MASAINGMPIDRPPSFWKRKSSLGAGTAPYKTLSVDGAALLDQKEHVASDATTSGQANDAGAIEPLSLKLAAAKLSANPGAGKGNIKAWNGSSSAVPALSIPPPPEGFEQNASFVDDSTPQPSTRSDTGGVGQPTGEQPSLASASRPCHRRNQTWAASPTSFTGFTHRRTLSNELPEALTEPPTPGLAPAASIAAGLRPQVVGSPANQNSGKASEASLISWDEVKKREVYKVAVTEGGLQALVKSPGEEDGPEEVVLVADPKPPAPIASPEPPRYTFPYPSFPLASHPAPVSTYRPLGRFPSTNTPFPKGAPSSPNLGGNPFSATAAPPRQLVATASLPFGTNAQQYLSPRAAFTHQDQHQPLSPQLLAQVSMPATFNQGLFEPDSLFADLAPDLPSMYPSPAPADLGRQKSMGSEAPSPESPLFFKGHGHSRGSSTSEDLPIRVPSMLSSGKAGPPQLDSALEDPFGGSAAW